MTAHVVVIGDAAVDIVTRPSAPLAFGDDVRSRITMSPGGAAANTAAWLAFCGASVTLVSRIGDDPAGALLRRSLTDAGVRCEFTVDPEAATGCVVALVDPDGQRTMMSDRGANARLNPEDVDAAVLAGAGHLHLSGYVLLDSSSRPAGLAALDLARAAGLTTSVDPQSAAMIDDPAAFADLLRGVDLLLPNAAELAALTGSGLYESGLSRSGPSETAVSEAEQSETVVSETGLSGSEVPEIDWSEPEASKAGRLGSEGSSPGLSETAASGSGLSESEVSGSGSSELGIFGTELSGSEASRGRWSRSEASETAASEADRLEARTSQPSWSGSEISETGLSETAVSEAGQSETGVSGIGLSGSGVSGFGSSGFGISGSGVRALLEVVGAVAVTSGADGATWLGPSGTVSVPGEAVDCVNSTGAGDAFNAGFLTAWLAGAEPRTALQAGVRAGALAVGQVGAWPVSPR